MNAPIMNDEQHGERISAAALRAGLTVATAESLTGGQISCVLGAAPSSSKWYQGSVVAYASSVKHKLLNVSGPVVSEASARTMASAVAELLEADVALSITGVGGPEQEEGHEPGTIWFGLFDCGVTTTEFRYFSAEPQSIIDFATTRALELIEAVIEKS